MSVASIACHTEQVCSKPGLSVISSIYQLYTSVYGALYSYMILNTYLVIYIYIYIFIIWTMVFHWKLKHLQNAYVTTSGTRCVYFPISPLLVTYKVNSKISRHFHCCCFENTNGLCFVFKTKLTKLTRHTHSHPVAMLFLDQFVFRH